MPRHNLRPIPEPPSTPDARAARVAGQRGGIISREELAACGLSRSAIHRRVCSGRLMPRGPNVFQLGPVATEDAIREAALEVGGDHSELSHHSAVEVLGAGPRDPRAHHITVPRGRQPGRSPDVVVHHARSLGPGDVRLVRGMRVTAPGRTALDMGAVLPPSALSALVTTMLHMRLLTPAAFAAVASRHRGHPGLGRLMALAPGRTPTESPLEDRVRDEILDPLEVPGAVPQYWITGLSGRRYRADFAYPQARVLVEADSRAHHDRVLAFDDDRERDADLAAVGWLTLRITHEHVERTPAQTRARVDATLASRTRLEAA
jgi:very-short-patch-repair endonuclease